MSTENQQKDISCATDTPAFSTPSGGEGGEAVPEAADSGTQNTFEPPGNAEHAKPRSGVLTAIVIAIVLLILLVLLAVIFRDQIRAFLWGLIWPIGPGGMVGDPLR